MQGRRTEHHVLRAGILLGGAHGADDGNLLEVFEIAIRHQERDADAIPVI